MPSVQRKGDSNSAGGVAKSGVATVRVNGKPVVVNGTGVSAHAPWKRRAHPPHAAASTKGGSATVRAGGIPINTTGNADTCGHSRVGGSPNVRIG
jgi:uncharacterized Zn-binding protein involved in type VI secretion|tara:strand:+ start:2955 stop:3239 length:285 start_codon:yes stop_codon:yes gene_type:complete